MCVVCFTRLKRAFAATANDRTVGMIMLWREGMIDEWDDCSGTF